MCGIYGTTRIYTKDIFEKKLDRIKFRGPEFTGLKNIDEVIFGHNRLSIIDLSSKANQPLLYKHLMITFNGEIYNYQILKKEFESQGYSFFTKSDTEVLCVAYLAYGFDCVSKINGMFAFAIYDSIKKIIFGARDRLGKKPFYYSTNNGFEFSSQPSAIKIERNDIHIDEESIQKYILFGHIPEPDSIYKEIKKLPPGNSFIYNTVNHKFSNSIYWDVLNTKTTSYSQSYSEAKNELHDLLNDAVKIRLQSDVSIGTFLSGGIDSTLITALCKNHNESIEAFSIGFPGSNMDESLYAKEIANHLGVKHKIIDCNPNDGLELINNITYYYDEPYSDSSAIPSMLLCKTVRPYATVALSGDGGDENFIGYLRTKWINQVLQIYKFPKKTRNIIAKIVNQIPYYRIKLIAQGLRHDCIEKLIISLLSSQYFFSEKIIEDLPEYQNLVKQNDIPLFQKMADLDIQFYLLNDCNVKIDRAASFAAMEVRSPFLDYRVVEFARNLPIKYRYENNVQKRILRDILYDYVPKYLLNRPKSGFAIPLKDWFRNELKDFVYNILSDTNLDSIPFIDKKMVKQNIKLHMECRLNFYAEIWKLIVLIKWLHENE